MTNLLLIEDDEALLTTYETTLKDEGYRVVKALDGQEGLLKLRNEKFDLIVTDLVLPRVSGSQLIRELRREANGTTCPIVIASKKADSEMSNKFSDQKNIHFLPTPVSAAALKERVKELLGNSPAKSRIDVRIVNPVLNATVEVISKITNYSISVGKPYVKTADEASGDISGVVGVTSQGFRGCISLSFADSGFLKVLSQMLGEETKEITDENKDGVAELLNMIFGRAKSTLNESGMNIELAIPSIIRGKGHIVDHHGKLATIVIPFSAAEIGPFRAEVSSSGN